MGLSADLSVSVQSLLASTEAMDVTTTNIANENTSGYARRVVVLEEATPSGEDGSTTGVEVKEIESLRDTVVDMAINANTSEQNASSTLSSSLSAVQTLFSDTASGSISSRIDSFFSALQELSTSPTDTSLRADALTAADNVASAFQSTAEVISQARQQADQSVKQETSDANSLLQQIATTNQAISTATAEGQNDNADEDQRSSLLTQLSAIMNFQTVNSSDGLTLTTTTGVPLVVGNTAYALTNQVNSSGYNDVYAGGTDITSTIDGGNLGGYLEARDQTLSTMGTQLDQFAFDFAQAVHYRQLDRRCIRHRRRAHQRLADCSRGQRRRHGRQLQPDRHAQSTIGGHHRWQHPRQCFFQPDLRNWQHNLAGLIQCNGLRKHHHPAAKPAELGRGRLA
jgi:flagellar hook-associated protein 1 FlgK